MKKLITTLLLLSGIISMQAQQDPLVSMYMFNALLINPAYAGTKPYVRTTLLHRSQWVGWKGAPMTDVVTIDGRIKDKVSALGLIVSNDRLGVTNKTDVYANYAYHIGLGKRHTLSLGLKGGLSWFNAKLSGITAWDPNDEVYTGGNQNNFLPNFGVGAFLYSERFYAGLSVPQALSYDPREMFSLGKDVSSIPQVRRHYLLTTGYAMVLSRAVVLKPSIMLRYVYASPLGVDLNAHVLLNDILWLGASYRINDAVIGMIQLQIFPAFRVGYAYDYTLSQIGDFSSGTHEIMLGYDLAKDVLKMKTPRYF